MTKDAKRHRVTYFFANFTGPSMAEHHGHLRRYDIAAPRLRRARLTAKTVPSLAQSLALLRSAARPRRVVERLFRGFFLIILLLSRSSRISGSESHMQAPSLLIGA